MTRKWIVGLLALTLIASNGGRALSQPQPPGPRPTITLAATGLTAEWFASPPVLADGIITVPGYPQLKETDSLSLPVASLLVALPPGALPSLTFLAFTETDLSIPMAGTRLSAIEFQSLGLLRGIHLARLIFYPARPVNGKLRWTSHLKIILDYGTPEGLTAPQTVDADSLRARVRSTVVNPGAARPAASPNVMPGPTVAAATPPTLIAEVNQPGLTALTYESLSALNAALVAADPHNLHLRRAGVDIPYEWDGNDDNQFKSGERLLFYAAPRFSRWTNTDTYFLTAEATPGPRMTARSAEPTSLLTSPAWVTQLFESNTYYTPNCYECRIPLGRNGDRWVWDLLRRPDLISRNYSFNLPDIDSSRPATLTVWLLGYTDIRTAAPDHRVDASLNGTPIGNVQWDGKQAITATFSIPVGALIANNSLTLALPGLAGITVEGAWLDAFSLTYARSQAPVGSDARFGSAPPASTFSAPAGPNRLYLPVVLRNASFGNPGLAYRVALAASGPYRAYDLTNPDIPERLTNFAVNGNTIFLGGSTARDYLVTADARPPANLRAPVAPQHTFPGADYIIISPPDFMPALGPLISLRQSQGLQVALENVRAIYDAYDGRATPDAIRAYLADAYAHWNPRPTYVLLVGDGVYDVKNYFGHSPPTFIPPYLADVDPVFGETAADNRYAAVDGADNLPDLLIGRLPVNTLAEAQTVVQKIVGYETNSPAGNWNMRALLVADNPDPAGDFRAQSQTLAATYFTPPVVPLSDYYAPPTTTVEAVHQSLLMQWNAGAGLLMFTGHSSDVQWAVERLFHLDDVPALQNGLQLPVVLEMTCFTGSFQMLYPTLDETLVRAPAGGAVAVWGATGEGVSTGHTFLADGFLENIYYPAATARVIGEAALDGKLNLLASGSSFTDLVDTYTLLGDPATRMNLSTLSLTNTLYLPLIGN